MGKYVSISVVGILPYSLNHEILGPELKPKYCTPPYIRIKIHECSQLTVSIVFPKLIAFSPFAKLLSLSEGIH